MLEHLPFEIIALIFSYFDQVDCLELMCVNWYWYINAPSYAYDLWKIIDFSAGSPFSRIYNTCFLCCLDLQLQSVTVPYSKLRSIIHTVVIEQCVITELVIPNGIKGIENIPQASARFFNIIETLIGSNLTTLSILNHHDVSLLRIATACPLLQHLYVGLDPEPESPTEEDGYHVDNNATPLLIHLVYLVLDFKFQFSSRVFPLLQQAPNLRILHFISSSPSDFIPQVMENNNIDFIQIMVTCPKIYHLECHFDDLDYLNLVQDHQTICNNDRYDGLRRLIYNDDDYVTSPRSGRVLQLLHHVYSTLTVLKIKQFWCPRYQNSMSTPAWADLVSVSLPALQDFSTEYLNKPDMDAVCIFLKQYQHNVTSSLKSVALHVWSSSFNDHLFSALFHIYSLISVKFDVNDVFDRVEVDTWASVPNNVGSFRYLSRNLRTIQIYGDIRFSGGDSELRDQYTRRLTHTDYTNELSITYTKIS